MSAPEGATLPAGVAFIGCGPAGVPVEPPAAIGFKAHNLARMAALGLPVPPGFVLGTRWCARPADVAPALWRPALAVVEQAAGLRFGDSRRPLLLSVRSGAPVSMPGMMETLLNIGLTDATVPGLLRLTGNPRLVWDAYRRLIAGYGEVVLGVPPAAFEADLAAVGAGIDERDLDFIALRELAQRHQATCRREVGERLPQDPLEQLQQAIATVFASWQSGKARAYRAMKGLADDLGTAVTVQRMVFGNAGGTSGAGVGFTRHPASGDPELWVDFLFNAQGEDVVSGRRRAPDHDALARVSPAVWSALRDAAHRLEVAFRDMQDLEFTVEDGRLYLLQTRDGKRTPQATARIALDLADEGLISAAEARRRTARLQEADLAVARVVAADGVAPEPVAWAISASHGVASGEIVLDEQHARARQAAGVPVLLLRQDAETRDIAALECAVGLLTARGARTSHAAVVGRQLGKVCLVGCDALRIDLGRRTVQLGDQELVEGDVLTIDGNTGAVYAGRVQTVREAPPELLARLAALR